MLKRALTFAAAAAMAAAPVTAARPEGLGGIAGAAAGGIVADKALRTCWRHKILCGGGAAVAAIAGLSARQILARKRMAREAAGGSGPAVVPPRVP